MKTVYLPLARVTFSMPDATAAYEASLKMLEEIKSVDVEVIAPPSMLTSPESVSDFLAGIDQPSLIIYQCTTFIGGDFVSELTRRFNCPTVIWSLREPSIDGGRLKLNSLTGAFSAGNNLCAQQRKFWFLFGSPDEVFLPLKKIVSAFIIREKLQQMVIGVVGSQPAGFGFGNIDEAALNNILGVRVARIEASGIIKTAAGYIDEEYAAALEELKNKTKGWETLPAENLDKHARLRTAYGEFAARNGVSVVASRCWPDFFTEYGAPVCAALSFLNDCGIPASCETDMGGAISMYIGSQLTGSAAYFGDPVAIDEACSAIVFWHCGAGATSLARRDTGATLGVHPNRKTGPTMEFGLKQGAVTVMRLGKYKDGFRMMAMKGVALDQPQKFWGTSVAVSPLTGTPKEKIDALVKDGWEPHFVVAYGEITNELRLLSELLNIDYQEY